MTADHVFRSFLKAQYERSGELAANSEVLTLYPLTDSPEPPTRYIASYNCTGIVRDATGAIVLAEAEFSVGIALSEDHLRRVDPLRVITWLDPPNIFHPNISPPYLCTGHVSPGIEVVDLLLQVYDILSYYNWASEDALNEEAAAWARRHQRLFPVERRPLRRRPRRRKGIEGGDL